MTAPLVHRALDTDARGRSAVTATATAVIVAYHRPDHLRRLLAGLDGQVPVVVVNIEDDPEVADVADAHGATTVPTGANVGYAAGVNRGAGAVTSDVVVFMNDDLVVTPDTIRGLAGHVTDGWDVAVPGLLTPAGEPEATILALPTVGRLLVEWCLLPDAPVPGVRRALRVEKWRRPVVAERVDAATAAIVACRADLLAAVPVPERYFLYWEELDWFFRLSRRHARVVFDPTLTCVHHGGRDDVRPAKARLMATNAVRCVVATQGRARGALAWPVVVAWNARTLVVDGAGAVVDRRRRDRARARAAGFVASLGAVREVLRR